VAAWETFTLLQADASCVALESSHGSFLSAANTRVDAKAREVHEAQRFVLFDSEVARSRYINSNPSGKVPSQLMSPTKTSRVAAEEAEARARVALAAVEAVRIAAQQREAAALEEARRMAAQLEQQRQEHAAKMRRLEEQAQAAAEAARAAQARADQQAYERSVADMNALSMSSPGSIYAPAYPRFAASPRGGGKCGALTTRGTPCKLGRPCRYH